MNKKGIDFVLGAVIALIIVLVVFVILLQALGLMSGIFGKLGQDSICEASFIASALSKQFGSQILDPKCQTNRITITMEEEGETESGAEKAKLDKDYDFTLVDVLPWDTYQRVRTWNSQILADEDTGNDNLVYPYLSEIGLSPDEPAQDTFDRQYIRRRYNMDKLIADEMKRCWDITGNGKLPLFDNYWNFIGCRDTEDGPVRECKDAGDFWDNVENTKDWETRWSANFCVLCARIKFDEEVATEFGEQEYDSINMWMSLNPWQIGHEKSYYEYILDEDMKQSFFKYPTFKYSTEEPYAVMFVRMNFHAVPLSIFNGYRFVGEALDILPSYEDDVSYANLLTLVPYSEVSNQCNYIVGSYI